MCRRHTIAMVSLHLPLSTSYPVHLSDHGLQVFGFESLLLHAKQNRLDWVRRAHGVVPGFIRFDQGNHGLEVCAVLMAPMIFR